MFYILFYYIYTMTNPDTYIRKAYITLLSGITSGGQPVPIFDTQVPKDAIVPLRRIILSTQTKNQANTSKCGHNWNCSILLDIIYEQRQGFIDRMVTDDIEEQISNIVDLVGAQDIAIPPFVVLNTQMLDSHDMSLNTPTTSITRKLVRYQHILQGIYPGSIDFLVTIEDDNLVTSDGDFIVTT